MRSFSAAAGHTIPKPIVRNIEGTAVETSGARGNPARPPRVARSMVLRLPAFAFALFASASASAGGFYLQEQSSVGIGRAFAGEAALGKDPSTVYFNPAGMTRLDGAMVELGATALLLHARQSDRGSTRGVPGVGQVPVSGGTGSNPFDDIIPIPTVHAAMPLTTDKRLWAGISVSAPFGLVVKYDEDWFGRYDSVKSEVLTYNIQPSFAYRLSDILSVGAGVDVQYIDATLTSALPNLSPLQSDGGLRINGNDWSVGYNVGVLVEQGPVRAGIHYRSRIEHRLDGYFRVEGLLGPLAAANREIDAEAPITLPEIITISLAYEKSGWRGLFSANFYNWSRFEAIRVYDKDDNLLADSPQNYRNTHGYHLGVERDLSPRHTVRAGFAYDETPTTDAYRTTRVPDGDRYWATAGADLHHGPWTLTGSYAHVFVTSEDINRTDPLFAGTPAATTVTIHARNSGNVDMVALALTRRF